MSFAASAGPPPNRSNGVNGGGPAGGHDASTVLKADDEDDRKGPSRIFPHIDDLIAARPDVDIRAPLRRLLLEAESYAKQADTHLDFRRPDLALQEHIKATIIAVEYIPRHKAYPDLKADRGELHRMWVRIQKRINAQHANFEEVKNAIKEENARSGVRPILSKGEPKDAQINGSIGPKPRAQPNTRQADSHASRLSQELNHRGPLMEASSRTDVENASPFRKKPPPVQPKPDALVGNAINHHTPPVGSTKAASAEDLGARFARLRGSGSPLPLQDPRIHTRPIFLPDSSTPATKSDSRISLSSTNRVSSPIPDRPQGPRDMPRAPAGPLRPQKIAIGTQIPDMPRAPDAIYSPARLIDLPGNVGLAYNASRNVYPGSRRTDSLTSANGVIQESTKVEEGPDYFSSLPRTSNVSDGNNSKGPVKADLPDSTKISAAGLMDLLKRGSHQVRVLLVDLRDRALFDAGHIMSHSIICIEPIVLRREITAEEVGQSIILSPESEHRLFEKRHEFDVLVYYDQASTSDDQGTASQGGYKFALRDFGRAVYDYDFDQPMKRRPMLLIGGLDAWIDLMGLGSLATSSTMDIKGEVNGHSSIANTAVATERRVTSRRKSYESRALTKEEETRWVRKLTVEDLPGADDGRVSEIGEWSYAKTTEDFLRRYPEVSPIQESMIVPRTATSTEPNHQPVPGMVAAHMDPSSHHDGLNAMMSKAPQRPTPAVPRPSYSGISEKSHGPTAVAVAAHANNPTTISRTGAANGRCGLQNLGNTCFMNSIIQCLSATPALRAYLTDGGLDRAGKLPRNPRKNESTDPRQSMARHLEVLLKSMWSGAYAHFSPKYFCQHVRDSSAAANIHGYDGNAIVFGDGSQQDASEFLAFVLDNLDDETNMRRDLGSLSDLTPPQVMTLSKQPLLNQARQAWKRYIHNNSSLMTELFHGQDTTVTTCKSCNNRNVRSDAVQYITLPLRQEREGNLRSRNQQLIEVLHRRYASPVPALGYVCDKCHQRDTSTNITYLSRCPEYMIIILSRPFRDGSTTQGSKIEDVVRFPLDGLDMGPFFVPTNDGAFPSSEQQLLPPFKYSCYAVIQHTGRHVHSGHYWALIRDTEDPRGPSSNLSNPLPASCFVDVVLIPLPVWIYIILVATLAVLSIHQRQKKYNPSTLHLRMVHRSSILYRILLAVYYLLLIANILMTTLEIVRLSLIHFGVGLLPFSYVALLLGLFLHLTDGGVGQLRLKRTYWIAANEVAWLGLMIMSVIKTVSLVYMENNGTRRKGTKYLVSDQVIDVAVMSGVYLVIGLLELGLAPWEQEKRVAG
ncbi:MAG: ubiquitin-specific protease doa4 [Claussenomyces sp. TS43310]|nr:MAG: ubiquitin-specific protease doa4 [Claussenomyces sp. TS43310]